MNIIENADLSDRAVNQISDVIVPMIKERDKEIERLNQYLDFYKDLIERQNKDLERLNNIIKEVREYIKKFINYLPEKDKAFDILEILDNEK